MIYICIKSFAFSRLGVMAATVSFCYPNTFVFFFSLLSFLQSAESLQFQIPSFNHSESRILYLGDAVSRGGVVEFFNNVVYSCRVGWAIYANRVLLWDSSTRRLTDFTTHFSFIIDTSRNMPQYGQGFVFFLAPFGFQIPPNSAGGFLGLFNTTARDSSQNSVVHVEFDSYPNSEWGEKIEHVGINENSISSSVSTPWNASFHSGDPADVWISYNATTKNLSVSWKYQTTANPHEDTSLSYQIDLMNVLPQWVTLGFSAATSVRAELTTLRSWEFHSTLDESEEKVSTTRLLVILTTVLGGLLIVGAIAAYAIFRWRKKMKMKRLKAMELKSINDNLEKGAGPRRFSLEELASATYDFSQDRKLGEGGFGVVYKGYFADSDQTVAVKKVSRGSRQGKKEYATEIKVISLLGHLHLVQLIGWCHDVEKGEFLLVYEFMQNGSLDAYLFGKKPPLPWSKRHKIALGLAKGLLYLHEEWEQCVLHRDIKASNVMLDSNFNVKLGDFGLAKLMDHELAPQTTDLVGTPGYVAPEYIGTRMASKESDVYSFGLVLLEIGTGKQAVDIIKDRDGERKRMIKWVWDHYGRKELSATIDERLWKMGEEFDVKQVECLMIVGLWCAHPDKNMRPTIRKAIQALISEADLPNLEPNMPVPVYHNPAPPPLALSSGNASTNTTESIDVLMVS